MSDRLIIIGAGGHGAVVADIAIKAGYREIAFIDDNAKGFCLGFPVIGTTKALNDIKEQCDFVIAIGNSTVREKIASSYKLNYVSLIHPSAVIGTDASVGEGTVVMAGAVINPKAEIGKHSIINTSAVVEHDNVLGDFVHISPCAALGGTVTVGSKTHIGIGACVRNNIQICGECTIGAGAVVVKNITEKGVYIGVPARKKESEK